MFNFYKLYRGAKINIMSKEIKFEPNDTISSAITKLQVQFKREFSSKIDTLGNKNISVEGLSSITTQFNRISGELGRFAPQRQANCTRLLNQINQSLSEIMRISNAPIEVSLTKIVEGLKEQNIL